MSCGENIFCFVFFTKVCSFIVTMLGRTQNPHAFSLSHREIMGTDNRLYNSNNNGK